MSPGCMSVADFDLHTGVVPKQRCFRSVDLREILAE
jgi:hypothetical protein